MSSRTFAGRGGSRQPGDSAAVAVAIAVTAGAWWSGPIPLVAAVAVSFAALTWRRATLLVLAGFLLGASLGARSLAGLRPVESREVSGTVTLVSDPQERLGAVRVDVRLGHRRLEAWARGRAASRLRQASAGNVVRLTGRIEPVPSAPWLVARHVAGRLVIDEISGVEPGWFAFVAANTVRGILLDGAEALPSRLRPLFGGFVLGDDRGERPEVEDDFRGAGLTHLLVVSGQNVAFVLAVATPVLARLPRRLRWPLTLGLLVFFALLTRFEPSVLRATVMAGLTATATAWGRPVSSLRVLALAVTILVLVDPLLVRSVGFQLSVAACVGIALFSRSLSDACPGPRFLGRAVGVTLAAQVAVAPLLAPLAGGLPLVAVPANVLAEPVAGFVMAWGMTAGIAAGLVPAPVSSWLHVPTTVGLSWVAGVASRGSALGWGQVGLVAIGFVAIAVGLAVFAARGGRRMRAAACLAVALLIAVSAARSTPSVTPRVELGAGAELSQAQSSSGGVSSVLVIDGRADAAQVLAGLRRAGVRALDLLVVSSASTAAVAVAGTVRDRVVVGTTWGPVSAALAEADTPVPGAVAQIGPIAVRVVSVSPRLSVQITGLEADVAASPDPAVGP